MQLEVIVTNAQEALAAQNAGATRVELVSDWQRGGLTPQARTVAAVARAVSLPVYTIVRPTDNGFVYDRTQRSAILESAATMRDLGASGVVFGALDPSRHIDVDFVKEVLSESRLPMTFHRAFDGTPNLSASYASLAEIEGVERVLTAGGAGSAWEGRFWLRELCCGNTIPWILGAGAIDAENLAGLIRFTGLREIHVGGGVRTEGTLDAGKIEKLAHLLHLSGRR